MIQHDCRHIERNTLPSISFTEINFDYFYFTSSELLKNENFLLLSLPALFRFERTNLNSARAICVCFFILLLVGLVGLEPTTPALSTRCSNQLSYSPSIGGG